MTSETTIPMLPCHSIDAVLAFYRVLEFEVTYQQAKPNVYAVVQRGGIELHFFAMREYDPKQSYSTCYICVLDVDGLYQAFMAGLRQAYGSVPSAGIPRVIPLKNKAGRREFIVVDPGGNWIRIGQPVVASQADQGSTEAKTDANKLTRALHAATLLSDAGHDDRASTMLDVALAEEQAAAIDRVAALVFRAGLAITMGDQALAGNILADVRRIPLQPDQRQVLAAELQRAGELEQMIIEEPGAKSQEPD